MVLSLLLFNLLVDTLADAIRSAVPGVGLTVFNPSDSSASTTLAILIIFCESLADLQAALSAVYAWSTCCPFTFGIGPKHVNCHCLRFDSGVVPLVSIISVVCLFRWCRSIGILACSHTMSQLASSRRLSLCLCRPSGPFDQRMVSRCGSTSHFCPLCSLRLSCPGRLPVWSISATPQPCSSSTCHSDIFGR